MTSLISENVIIFRFDKKTSVKFGGNWEGASPPYEDDHCDQKSEPEVNSTRRHLEPKWFDLSDYDRVH